MATTPVKLPIHHHPLSPFVGFFTITCKGCNVYNVQTYYGYGCIEPFCSDYFHKECAEAPLVINHLFHPEHPLQLTNDSGDGPCDLCGQKLLAPCYSCPTCEFKLDLLCGIKPSPLAIEHPLCHDHPLVFLKKREEGKVTCELCKDSIGGPSYSCLECKVWFHVDCVHLSKEISHPCHSSHPLKLIESDTLQDVDADKFCLLCNIYHNNMHYYCSICNFTACLDCTKNPQPLVYEHAKTHTHPLTLFPRRISFTCDICGEIGTAKLYVCFQCEFVIHGKCIGLARVVKINRHEHRISFRPHLGAGYSNCGVCRKSISQYYGAYSCSVCPNYAVHTGCVTGPNVWDWKELEGIPDGAEGIIAPFKVVSDNLICHFSHGEHPLRLHKENTINDEHKRCKACSHQVGFGSIYVCEECCFYLHEKCANLPVKKIFVFSIVQYTLKVACRVNCCPFCGIYSDGFKYTGQEMRDIDVHCGSLSEPFIHDCHIHPLYYYDDMRYSCSGCYKTFDGHVFRCEGCEFCLCFSCASLPEKIWYRNDGHPLTLCCVGKASIKNWCDICERELEPRKWFYTCSVCEVTLHVQCVLGDFSRLTPETNFSLMNKSIDVVLNINNTRPLCSQCHTRCNVSVILKHRHEDGGYICSSSCLRSFLDVKI